MERENNKKIDTITLSSDEEGPVVLYQKKRQYKVPSWIDEQHKVGAGSKRKLVYDNLFGTASGTAKKPRFADESESQKSSGQCSSSALKDLDAALEQKKGAQEKKQDIDKKENEKPVDQDQSSEVLETGSRSSLSDIHIGDIELDDSSGEAHVDELGLNLANYLEENAADGNGSDVDMLSNPSDDLEEGEIWSDSDDIIAAAQPADNLFLAHELAIQHVMQMQNAHNLSLSPISSHASTEDGNGSLVGHQSEGALSDDDNGSDGDAGSDGGDGSDGDDGSVGDDSELDTSGETLDSEDSYESDESLGSLEDFIEGGLPQHDFDYEPSSSDESSDSESTWSGNSSDSDSDSDWD